MLIGQHNKARKKSKDALERSGAKIAIMKSESDDEDEDDTKRTKSSTLTDNKFSFGYGHLEVDKPLMNRRLSKRAKGDI